MDFKGSLQHPPPAFIPNSRMLIEMFSVGDGRVRFQTPDLTISRLRTRETPLRATDWKERGLQRGVERPHRTPAIDYLVKEKMASRSQSVNRLDPLRSTGRVCAAGDERRVFDPRNGSSHYL